MSDHTGRVVESNAIAEKLLGIPSNEHKERRIDADQWRIIRPNGTPMPADEYASVRALHEKRLVENIEMGIVKPDAGITWINVTAAPLNLEDYGVVVTYGDVTARREAEVQLRLQSLVLNQIQDRVTVTDLDGVITYVNDATVRALGYARDELIGVSTEKYGENPERGATQREIVQETLEHGQWRGEIVNQTADGQELILDCRTQVVFDGQNRRIALAGISTDITERKRAEGSPARGRRTTGVCPQCYRDGGLIS